MRLLVTGGAGFIGSNFVNRFADKYESLTVLDKFTYSGVRKNLSKLENLGAISVIEGDISNQELVQKIIPDFDSVINFAAESHVDRSIKSSREFINTNIVGVQILLDAIKQINPKIRFLQVSTDEVYGSINYGSWGEDAPMLPNSPYSASKASGEMLARSYHITHGLDILISRCSNNYGIRHFPEKFIPLAITNILEGKKVPIYGSGSNIRDWLHVDDHCDALHLIIHNAPSGSIYNIGGGTEINNLDLAKKILTLMGRDENLIEFIQDRKGHDYRYSVNWSKIHSELAYSPKIEFEEGLENTIIWYEQNIDWWKSLKDRAKF